MYGDAMRAPRVLEGASLLFQAEAYPAAEPYMALLPENFLVSNAVAAFACCSGITLYTLVPTLQHAVCSRQKEAHTWYACAHHSHFRPLSILQAAFTCMHWHATRRQGLLLPLQVSYSDIVPGLRRFDHLGQLSTTRQLAISTLASPIIAQPFSLALRGATLWLPQRLHDMLAVYTPGGVLTCRAAAVDRICLLSQL
jgi:hypothetical protein